MRKILIIFLFGALITSCIPNKDLVYFQGDASSKTSVHKILNEPYKLQVNDILDIKIKAADQELVSLFNQVNQQGGQFSNQFNSENIYFNSYTIDRHGNIRLPYVGELNVLGYTEKEVREKIEKHFESYFKDPNDIFITVKLAGIRFTVLGEVVNPGTLVLFQNQVNIIEAIANAGDIKITGNRKKIVLIRKQLDGIKKYSIDLTSIKSFDSEIFYIRPNDIISVEPLRQKSWGTGTTGAQTFTTIVAALSLVTTTILLFRTL